MSGVFRQAIQIAFVVCCVVGIEPAFCQADLAGTPQEQLARMNKILAELIALADGGDLTARSVQGTIDGLRRQQTNVEGMLPAIWGVGYHDWAWQLLLVDSELESVIGVDADDVLAGVDSHIEVAYDAIGHLITLLMSSPDKEAQEAVETLKGMMSSLLAAGDKYKQGIWNKDDLDRVLKDVVRRKYALMDGLPTIHGHSFQSWYEAFNAFRASLLRVATTAAMAGDSVPDLSEGLREAKRHKERIEEMFPER